MLWSRSLQGESESTYTSTYSVTGCLSKPKNQILGLVGVDVNALKKELHDCEDILHHQVDINDGCVYKFNDIYTDVWTPHPIHQLVYPTKVIYKDKATLVNQIRSTDFPCNKFEQQNNKIKLISMKQRCIKLRRVFQTPRCSPCQMKVLLEDPHRTSLEKCTEDSMTPPTIGLSHLYMNRCVEKLAAKDARANC